LILGGGCSANSLLRKEITEIKDIAVHLPKLKFCGDNSAMIAFYAFLLLKNRV
jgi:N6-L-threonylcarbamoyladenine synthase